MLFLSLFIVINATIVFCSESKPPFRSDTKCCPENYTYISAGHYCQKKKLINRSYTQENVPTISLPDCKIILDEDINSTDDYLTDNVYCFNKNEKGFNTLRKCYSNFDICKEQQCIKKCCPQGQSFVNSTTCQKTTQDYGLDLSQWTAVIGNYTAPYAIIYNGSCQEVKIINYKMHKFSIDNRGNFNITINGYLSTTWSDEITEMKSYCIEHFKSIDAVGFFFYMCAERLHIPYARILYPLMLSVIFVPITITAYIFLEETKKVSGQILICYDLAIFIWFGSISLYIFTDTFLDNTGCKVLAYFAIFARTSSFTWISVLCWDFWRTLGSLKVRMDDKYADRKKMFFYSVYGWGVPALQMVNLLVVTEYSNLSDIWRPILGKGKCLFAARTNFYGELVFIMIPNMLIQLFSLLFFVLTVVNCLKIKNEIGRINDTTKEDKVKKYQRDKQSLILLLKLMIIMGVIFIYETGSSAFTEEILNSPNVIITENIFNWINALQGVWIFLIFVCKAEHLKQCFKKVVSLSIVMSHSFSFNIKNVTVVSNVSCSGKTRDIPVNERTPTE